MVVNERVWHVAAEDTEAFEVPVFNHQVKGGVTALQVRLVYTTQTTGVIEERTDTVGTTPLAAHVEGGLTSCWVW